MIWMKRAALILGGLAVLAMAIVYGASEWLMHRRVAVDLPAMVAATDPADIAEGGRLARIEGCLDCHAASGEGRILVASFGMGRIVSPSLARTAVDASDEQLSRVIRNGVGIDGHPLFGMPTRAYNHLADKDLNRLVGWIRSIKLSAKDQTAPVRPGPLTRLGVVLGTLPRSITRTQGQPSDRPADTGAYFATIACTGCHAFGYSQSAGLEKANKAPALLEAVAGYNEPALRKLLRTGQSNAGRQVVLMTELAHGGLDALTDAEVAAIHGYLKTVAAGN
jgi:mono/diheme cytochrome c family protein